METRAKFEQITPTGNESFRCFEIEGQRFNHPLHYHPEIELTLILESTGQRVVGDSVKSFSPGNLCLLGENLPHLYHNDGAGPTEGPARAIVMQFRRDIAGGMLDAAPEFQPIAALLDRAERGLDFHRAALDKIREPLGRLLIAPGPERLLLLLNILITLAEAEASTLASVGYRPTVSEHQSERITSACQYIFDHFQEDIAQSDVAQHIGYSPSAFTRFFRRHTHQTFRQFLSEVRLGQACNRLLHSDQSITEIAYDTGFKNQSSFNRSFRERYGISPREYRKQGNLVRLRHMLQELENK